MDFTQGTKESLPEGAAPFPSASAPSLSSWEPPDLVASRVVPFSAGVESIPLNHRRRSQRLSRGRLKTCARVGEGGLEGHG